MDSNRCIFAIWKPCKWIISNLNCGLIRKFRPKRLHQIGPVCFSSENWSSQPDGDTLGSEEEEQEDPKDYVKGEQCDQDPIVPNTIFLILHMYL
jgi:hypothetical protein